MTLPPAHLRLCAGLLLVAGAFAAVACQQQATARSTVATTATTGPTLHLPTQPHFTTRPTTPPFLNLSAYAYEALPFLLSETGAFLDTEHFIPAPQLLPYEVNAPLWTDAALKQRWIAIPYDPSLPAEDRSAISFTSTGEWYFPSGTVLVKQFNVAINENDPSQIRRVETRFLVRSHDGQVYGATYRWREDQKDAELLYDGRDDTLTITQKDGSTRTQQWHYPSRTECLSCHNRIAGGVLGVTTRQLNREFTDENGQRVNQLRHWNALGVFEPPISEEEFAHLPRMVDPLDPHADLTDRVRSYLDANCSHCHRPGAMPFVSYDARFETPLERQNLLYARPVNDYGIDRVRYIKPNDPWRSMVLVRLEKTDTMKMPPLGRSVVDHKAVNLLREWITSMDAPQALAPPTIITTGDPIKGPLTISATHEDPQATLYYTLDGTLPDDESPVLTKPIVVKAPARVRIKAIRNGFASSIALLTELHEP